ncbi:uncharacterized protein [Venturia canescens]|uniref:uncharacterized protein isoform X2 n=1 Tax=Venturia canescens TaxID=32260 RepID=UPI001C9BE7CA|nr:uncharacterized protein LOC122418082 isoform X2 [Venturia canescens]
MALVMLPCDLPWWSAIVKQLDRAGSSRTSSDLLDVMQRLHDMCNISLDPEEDNQDPEVFVGLGKFVDEDLNEAEREKLFTKTIPRIADRAKALRATKPPQGLYFSLQQQGDCVEYSYGFASSLLANAFFSTYPKRTMKTHPTLGDFNFTHFFKYLHLNSQKAKLRSILHYFDYLETESALEGRMIVSRQVMTSKEWLTIEDWLESDTPLCPLTIRHGGRIDGIDSEAKYLHVCFSSSRFGGGVLEDKLTQETVHIATHPEILAAILSVEALEDNEVLIVEGARRVSRINDPKHKAIYESISEPIPMTVCYMDPEDYSKVPLTQFEEDNVLREMNKSLLGFRQRRPPSSPIDSDHDGGPGTRRLSPIGESFGSTSPEIETEEKAETVVKENGADRETLKEEGSESDSPPNEIRRRRPNGRCSIRSRSPSKMGMGAAGGGGRNATSNASRRSRFIVLGSSGEILPVTRKSLGQMSVYSSCNSQSTESFHSAKETMEEEEEEEKEEHQQRQPATTADEEEEKLTIRYGRQLDTPERRGTFAQRLKEALHRESTATGSRSSVNSSGESSYAVGISVTGSHVGDEDIKVKRGGSRGFVLRDETVEKDFFMDEPPETESKWLSRGKLGENGTRPEAVAGIQRRDTNASSKYSFSTEYSSEVYEQLSKWLQDPLASEENREMDARDRAVVQFAGSLLRRALSESFAGVPVQEGEPLPITTGPNDLLHRKHKLALAVRSLSLELARQRNKRQQSLPGESSPQGGGGPMPVVTGNWGCGSRLKGDPQLKLVIQWLAASLAGVPRLIYHTFGNVDLSKLDTVSRVLTDRRWSVGDLTAVTLRFAVRTIEERVKDRKSLFEELIGIDKPSP